VIKTTNSFKTISRAPTRQPRVCVVGIGGGGCHALAAARFDDPAVKAVAVSTDKATLSAAAAETHLQLGLKDLGGFGTGGDPDLGRLAATHDIEMIRGLFTDADVVVVMTCLGGGTGTGVAPVLLNAARESGAVTCCLATLPFAFEGGGRRKVAEAGLTELRGASDVLIALENDRLMNATGNVRVFDAFQRADHILGSALSALWRMVAKPCFVGIDLADLQELGHVAGDGCSHFAHGEAEGRTRAIDAAQALVKSPLLEDAGLLAKVAAAVVCVQGGADLTLQEVDEAVRPVREALPPEVEMLVGTVVDDALEGAVRVALFASVRGRPVAHSGRGTRAGSRPRSRTTGPRPSKAQTRQAKLRLDAPDRRRFKDVEPTILNGEDLDIPTYIRRELDVGR
jgi:cell division protein FtsZ